MITIGNDWDELLKDEFQKDYYQQLVAFLKHEYSSVSCYPPMIDIFNSLRYTACRDIKVVIIGQDPYINHGEAHGLAFSVQPGIRIPPSLLNIFKELREDIGCFIPDNGCLIPWARQGVLLLNTILTVREGISKSHRGKGWEVFTDKIIEIIDRIGNPAVFMLWGRDAQQKMYTVNTHSHLILTAAHPSPLAGDRFFGCKHFSRANDFLQEKGYTGICWQIPNVKKEKA